MQKLKEPRKTVREAETTGTREQLELGAYYHWLERGCPLNDSLTDWVEAEKKMTLVEEEEED